MEYEEFLKGIGVNFEMMYFTSPVRTVSQASEVSGFPEEKIVKTIILKGRRNYAVIIAGKKRVDLERLKGMDEELRLASPEEVMEITGFPPGAVPPIIGKGGIITVLDKDLLNEEYVVGGGGKENSLVKIKVSDIIEKTNPIIMEL